MKTTILASLLVNLAAAASAYATDNPDVICRGRYVADRGFVIKLDRGQNGKYTGELLESKIWGEKSNYQGPIKFKARKKGVECELQVTSAEGEAFDLRLSQTGADYLRSVNGAPVDPMDAGMYCLLSPKFSADAYRICGRL